MSLYPGYLFFYPGYPGIYDNPVSAPYVLELQMLIKDLHGGLKLLSSNLLTVHDGVAHSLGRLGGARGRGQGFQALSLLAVKWLR